MPEEKNTQFIVCPDCGGSGRNLQGKTCQNCGGFGLGAFYGGVFVYCDLNLSKKSIVSRHIKNNIHIIINILALTAGIIGIVFLGLWFWQSGAASTSLESLEFWKTRHPFILAFWIGAAADMFVIYRLSEEKARSMKITSEEKYKKENNISIPNNWKGLKRYDKKINAALALSEGAMEAAENSCKLAEKSGGKIEIPHLFLGLLKDDIVAVIFSRLSVSNSDIKEKVARQLAGQQDVSGKNARRAKNAVEMSNNFKIALVESYIGAADLKQKKIEAVNFILPCLERDEAVREILYDFEIDRNKIYNCIKWFAISMEMAANYRTFKKMARFKPSSNMDRAYTAVATPILDHFSYDLTRQAKWGRLELCVSREDEIEKIFREFESGHRGIVIIGEPGVGKRAIVDGIAQLMVKEDVPAEFKDKRLIELDIARLVSGANVNEAQNRMLIIADEVGRAGNIILYIKDLENIIGIQAGEGESLDLSEVLSGALENNALRCIATSTPKNYSSFIEGRPIGRMMSGINIKEPETNKSIQILESKVGYIEGKYGIFFSYDALEGAVTLSDRYMHDKFLPEKAIEILESVAIKESKKRGKNILITKDNVAEMISEVTSIPVDKISRSEGEILMNLEEKIHERMIGQEEAVKMIAESLRRARVEMRDTKRPIANFLFLGPTGVGKTELAKTVAEVYFGNEKTMIRLDMSEYQHQDSFSKMIGDNEGHLGFLTEAVRKNPFSLVLLDEFEKAHPDILNLFLQVMDDGRLTDGQGRTIDFTNCIIVATSNAGAIYIEDEIRRGSEIENIKQVLIDEYLNKVMRPELINRFDGVVVFKPLSETDIVSITKLMLAKVRKMLELKGVGLFFKEDGVKHLAHAGFDPKFGARPLRRVLQDRIENTIANLFLSGELERRDTVVIDNDGQIKIEKGREL